MKNVYKFILVIILLLIFLPLSYWVLHTSNDNKGVDNPQISYEEISSFEECAEAGFPVMESYPEQCKTPDGRNFVRMFSEDDVPQDVIDHINSKSDSIFVMNIKPFSVINSPLKVEGIARGYWFFEASFPVVLVDWDGKIISEGLATAVLDQNNPESTWMTEDFVPFETTLNFSNPSFNDDFSRRGTLIFQKDNPSGLPENDNALEIPVLFEKID